jgi:hypothetical protein
MWSFAVAAGRDAGELSCDESDPGVNLPLMLCDERLDDIVGDLHSREVSMPSQLYRDSLSRAMVSI